MEGKSQKPPSEDTSRDRLGAEPTLPVTLGVAEIDQEKN